MKESHTRQESPGFSRGEEVNIIYETKGGKQYGESYDYFGLPNLLETLDKWEEEHS